MRTGGNEGGRAGTGMETARTGGQEVVGQPSALSRSRDPQGAMVMALWRWDLVRGTWQEALLELDRAARQVRRRVRARREGGQRQQRNRDENKEMKDRAHARRIFGPAKPRNSD